MRSGDRAEPRKSRGFGPSTSHYGSLSITGDMASLPCARHAQEQSQFRPAFLHVQDRRAKRGVRFDDACVKLRLHPVFERRHARPTFVLMELQALRGVETLVAGAGI